MVSRRPVLAAVEHSPVALGPAHHAAVVQVSWFLVRMYLVVNVLHKCFERPAFCQPRG